MSHYYFHQLGRWICGLFVVAIMPAMAFAQAPVPPQPYIDPITPVVITKPKEVEIKEETSPSDVASPMVSGETYYSEPSSTACDAPACDVAAPACGGDVACGSSDCCGCASSCGCGPFSFLWEPIDAKAKGAYKGVYYANDFSYLCDPKYCDWHLGENMKRICLGKHGVIDFGGEYRARFHKEQNFRGLGLTGVDDEFLLHRIRLYANYEVNDWLRFYAEMLHAVSEFEDFNPRPIEENYWDLQNLFVDIRLWDGCNGDLWGRYGRQELLYGNQRTVSPLDWANTRRTFEGFKVFWKGENWDIDAFGVRTVAPATTTFDKPNYDTAFYGMYSVYKGLEDATVDFYWLGNEDDRAIANRAPFQFHTFGSRISGKRCGWLYEAEGNFQTGLFTGNDHEAGSFTLGLGRQLSNHCWKPTLWAYYDWASGDNIIGNGYDHAFPLAHKYLGFMDLFGRRNIESFNFLLTAAPSKRLKLLAWYYIFNRENSNDVPYSVVMTPFTTDTSGGRHLGQELDLAATYVLSSRSDIVFGYSHFWTGSFYKNNGSVPHQGDADFFWTQFSVRF